MCVSKKITVFLFMLLFLCSGCGESTLDDTSTDNNWVTPNKELWNYQWVKGEQSDYKLGEYKPKTFSGKDKLQRKWSKVVSNDKHLNILSLEKGWLLDSDFNYGDMQLKGVIDPANGNFEEISDIYPFLGIYDGKNVYGSNLFRQSSSAHAWNAETKRITWSNCLTTPGANFFIVNGRLLHYTSSGGIILSRLNHCTGEVLWQTKNNDIAEEIISKTDLYLIVIGKNQNGKVYLHRINPTNDEIKTYIFASDIKTYSLANINNYVWIMLDNKLVRFDVEQFIEKESFDITNTGIIESIDQKMILLEFNTKKFNIFDTETETLTPLNVSSAKVINKSLIFEDEKQLRGINPETLETTWWIDLDENMKNAHVEWLDWRGVLVLSDNEIACYAPNK